jgi:hypothetical protein
VVKLNPFVSGRISNDNVLEWRIINKGIANDSIHCQTVIVIAVRNYTKRLFYQTIVPAGTRTVWCHDMAAARDARIADNPSAGDRVAFCLEVLPLSRQAGRRGIDSEGGDHYATSCSWPA